ncbi:MAG: IreB family regulatory phosphoprotein [Oscillospiraceae bacterium]|nr:IreB family regulatory phosphoprotein [Oscillospiraceae bacterium]
MDDFTRKFNVIDKSSEMKEIIRAVYEALKVKGYNPINQIVGYILSEDPTYITNYNGARSMITRLDRDELLSELVKNYLDSFK